MNIKRNITFALESRKKNGVLIIENVPIRMRVVFDSHRIEFTTGYRIDVAKWDAKAQRVKNGCTNKLKQSASDINADLLKQYTEIQNIFMEFEVQNVMPTTEQVKDAFMLSTKVKDGAELDKIKEPSIKFMKAYDEFVSEGSIQNAWSDFDYDTMKSLISDELFKNYKSQLKVLSAKKQKNIMHDFELIDAYISNFEKDGKYYSIDVIMTVSFYDYVVNKDGKVVRGKKKTLVENKYLLTYSKDERHSNICPNCGATLKKEDVTKCEYCKTIISNNNHDWILVKKQIKK